MHQLVLPGMLSRGVQDTFSVLSGLASRRPLWLLAFSGGKDSSALLILAVEFIRRSRPDGVRLEILYADTGLEMPPLLRQAGRMLAHAKRLANAEELPIRIHVVRPQASESFWATMVGRGYPLPGFRFRWCTDRLKVRPMTARMRELVSDPDRAVLLLGVRRGESAARDGRLRTSCARGECGPAMVGRASSLPAAAPLLHWSACQVWDFLLFLAPKWGWPTAELWRLYGNGENDRVRYGCWLCPLIRRDRAMEAAIGAAKDDQERHILEALSTLRERLLVIGKEAAGRVTRPDGRPGRLKPERRREILAEIRRVEREAGIRLLRPEELSVIRAIWEVENSNGNPADVAAMEKNGSVPPPASAGYASSPVEQRESCLNSQLDSSGEYGAPGHPVCYPELEFKE